MRKPDEGFGTTTSSLPGNLPTGDQKPSSVVGKCCRTSARMLQIADTGNLSEESRKACVAANHGQAKLLFEAAHVADEMLAALTKYAALTDRSANGGVIDKQELDAVREEIRAAIAKATGGQS